MKLVKFIHGHAPYGKGETAGFPDKTADWLVDRGVATPAAAGDAVQPPGASAQTKPARGIQTKPMARADGER